MNTNEHGNSDNAPGHSNTHHIILNGTQITVQDHHLTYEAIVKLAFPGDPQDGNLLYTVTYANPNGHDGTLAAGQQVVVKDGMSINVRKTNRS